MLSVRSVIAGENARLCFPEQSKVSETARKKELLLFHVEMLPSCSSSYSQVWRADVFWVVRGKRTRRAGKMKAILGDGN
jgi:hypothetical protein